MRRSLLLGACALLLAGYAYARARAFRDLDLVLEGDFPIEADPEIGFVPARNAASLRRHPRAGLAYHVFTSDRRARVSRRGERTAPEVSLLTVGDSFSWGHGVENEDTYTARLARRWGVPAANLAFSAYGTVQSLQMLQRSLDLRPRVVVYGFIADHMKRNISPCAPAYGPLCLPFSYVGIDERTALPTKEQGISMLMGVMKAPIGKFVSTLNEVPSKFVRTVKAVADQKQAQAKAA